MLLTDENYTGLNNSSDASKKEMKAALFDVLAGAASSSEELRMHAAQASNKDVQGALLERAGVLAEAQNNIMNIANDLFSALGSLDDAIKTSDQIVMDEFIDKSARADVLRTAKKAASNSDKITIGGLELPREIESDKNFSFGPDFGDKPIAPISIEDESSNLDVVEDTVEPETEVETVFNSKSGNLIPFDTLRANIYTEEEDNKGREESEVPTEVEVTSSDADASDEESDNKEESEDRAEASSDSTETTNVEAENNAESEDQAEASSDNTETTNVEADNNAESKDQAEASSDSTETTNVESESNAESEDQAEASSDNTETTNVEAENNAESKDQAEASSDSTETTNVEAENNAESEDQAEASSDNAETTNVEAENKVEETPAEVNQSETEVQTSAPSAVVEESQPLIPIEKIELVNNAVEQNEGNKPLIDLPIEENVDVSVDAFNNQTPLLPADNSNSASDQPDAVTDLEQTTTSDSEQAVNTDSGVENTDDDVIYTLERRDGGSDRAILVTRNQASKLRTSSDFQIRSFEARQLRDDAFGDISLNGLNGDALFDKIDSLSSEEKSEWIEALLKQANDLYREGKVNESQNYYAFISKLNKASEDNNSRSL